MRTFLPRPPGKRHAGSVDIVAMAASTGGPAALRTVLGSLPSTLSVPVVVVQHIAHDFSAGFAHWLTDGVRMPVTLARAGETMRPGCVYVAPDGVHLGVTGDGRTRLSRLACVRACRG